MSKKTKAKTLDNKVDKKSPPLKLRKDSKGSVIVEDIEDKKSKTENDHKEEGMLFQKHMEKTIKEYETLV